MTSSRKIRLSPNAEDDLSDIFQYTNDTWGRERAAAYRATLDKAFDELASFPGLGRARPDLGPDIRSFIAGQHSIVYAATGTELIVSRIVHVRRDVERTMHRN